MTRFIYLADTHSGADPMGYYMQPADENIAAAVDLFDLSVPVYLCLGNHDVTEEDSLYLWVSRAAAMLPGQVPTYTFETADCVIHVAPNQWEEGAPYVWRQQQQAHLLDEQMAELHEALRQRPNDPHILLTHSPVLGLPVEQTGYAEPYHAPPETFAGQVLGLVEAHSNIRCVLGAHSHMHMHVEHGGVHYVTTSSWSEAPFEFKVFEVDATGVSMSTQWLGPRVPFGWEYDFDRAFVQGRGRDRGFAVDAKE